MLIQYGNHAIHACVFTLSTTNMIAASVNTSFGTYKGSGSCTIFLKNQNLYSKDYFCVYLFIFIYLDRYYKYLSLTPFSECRVWVQLFCRSVNGWTLTHTLYFPWFFLYTTHPYIYVFNISFYFSLKEQVQNGSF